MEDLDLSRVENAWRWNIDTFAARLSYHKYVNYDWTSFLCDKLAEAATTPNSRIIITAPPRHGKSYMASLWFPAWYLDSFPENRIIITSYTQALAAEQSEKIRNVFADDKSLSALDEKRSTRTDWRLIEGGSCRAVGVGGSITGFGGHLILIDDPHKDWAEVQSPTIRKKTIDWYKGTLYTRLEPGGSIVLIQTRWHQRDLAGYLLDEDPEDWKEYRFPAIAEQGDILGRQRGDALCPDRYNIGQLEKIREAIGSQVFAGLYQQRPSPAEGGSIKREWIRFYGGPTGHSLPPDLHQYHSWDLNFGDTTSSGSYNVGQVWGVRKDGAWILDQVRGRWEYTETKKQFFVMSEKWPKARTKLIEKKAAGAPLISDLRGATFGIIPITPEGSKQARLDAVAGMFESGNVWLPHPSIAPWVPELVEELVAFPNAEADDQVDALTQALSHGFSRLSTAARLKVLSQR